MSNDLIKSLQNSVALMETGVDEDTRALAGSGNGVKKLSIKGGVFRKIVGGKEVAKIEDRHMNVIIVKAAHKQYRMYFGQTYVEGEKAPPRCWTSDSDKPDADVENPCASACNKCPFSVEGSGPGGKGKACRVHRRIAVVLPNDPSGDVMQLLLPGQSCYGAEVEGKRPFIPYAQWLANNNISINRVVTRIQFDTNSATPKLLFSAVSPVDPDDIDTIKQQGTSKAAEDAVKLSVYKPKKEVEAPVEVAPAVVTGVQADTAPEEDVAEPTVRKTEKVENAPSEDVSEVLKKWAKK
jgi:hypothetical protein